MYAETEFFTHKNLSLFNNQPDFLVNMLHTMFSVTHLTAKCFIGLNLSPLDEYFYAFHLF